MHWRTGVRSFVVLCSTLVGLDAYAQSRPNRADGPTINAVRVSALTVDGRLDEGVYTEHAPTTGFIQQEPHEGQPATERTEVWVFYDDHSIYFAARMWDSQPDRMIANEMRRDASDIYQNESLSVSFDTFNDKRTGYYLMTNILGA